LAWLRARDVVEVQLAGKTKPALLKLARTMKVSPKLKVEEALKGTNHRILWIPPYHCIYNPIEMASTIT